MPDQKSRLHGFYIIGFTGQCKLVWLVDTDAIKNVLSHKCHMRLPEGVRFPLHEDGSQVFVPDGRKDSMYGAGKMFVRIGSQDISITVLVPDTEDSTRHGIPVRCGCKG